jgi:uncharacterized membrane protein
LSAFLAAGALVSFVVIFLSSSFRSVYFKLAKAKIGLARA